jgi:transglutaminase-like putative cysteine protease
MNNSIRRLRVRHATHYNYSAPVQRSVHMMHLKPVEDERQRLIEHTLTVDPNGKLFFYGDVFGNPTARAEVFGPYSKLTIAADSIVEIKDTDPFAFAAVPIKRSFPLRWLPYQQVMLAPYMQLPELPETQIEELQDYALSFVNRCNGDLMETLFAINLTLYREYAYVPGSTALSTTAYQVYKQRKGVCQDFANLFICLARLLGFPARYVCGYVFTGNTGANRAGSDASHAWIELFIPNVGWKGFDPTNGVLPNTDHIRLAWGRHYGDTPPVSGTIYSKATETMTLDVEVSCLEGDNVRIGALSAGQPLQQQQAS